MLGEYRAKVLQTKALASLAAALQVFAASQVAVGKQQAVPSNRPCSPNPTQGDATAERREANTGESSLLFRLVPA
jgi:hypothetical protein